MTRETLSSEQDYKRAIVMLCDVFEKQRQALIVCGKYLATLNRGGTAGFNKACQAVEDCLGSLEPSP